MGKPDFAVYERFRKRYFELTKSIGKEQYLVPYLMSSHPGSTLEDALELALCLKRDGYAPEQVQDYYPTPGTASTVMFYTGIDPLTMKSVYVATDYHEKQLQRALLQYNRPQNAPLVREALIKLGREDLIGYGAECLVRPEKSAIPHKSKQTQSKPTTQGVKYNKKADKSQEKPNGKRKTSLSKHIKGKKGDKRK